MIIKPIAHNSIQITTENGDNYLITDSNEFGILIRSNNTNRVLVNPDPARQWENSLQIRLGQRDVK